MREQPANEIPRDRAHLSPALRRPLLGWVLAVAALVGLNVVVYVSWTHPRWRDNLSSRRNQRVINEAVRLLEPALGEARSSYGRVLQAELDVQQVRERVGSGASSVSEVLSVLQEGMQAAGMSFERASYRQEAVDELGLTELQITLPVSGSYLAFRTLVERLLASDAFLALDQVALTSSVRGARREALEVELLLSAFLVEEVSGIEDRAGAGEASSSRRPVIDTGSPLAVVDALRARLLNLPPLPVRPDAYEVRLEDVDAGETTPVEPARNLFAFAARRPPPEQPDKTAEPAPPAPRRSTGSSSPPAVQIPLKLVGIVRMGDLRMASIFDGTELHLAPAGAQLPGGFEVLAVGFDYADIGRGDERTRLSLES